LGKQKRRFPDRPRVTIRVLLWVVLAAAFFSGFVVLLLKRRFALGTPIEEIEFQAMILLIPGNGMVFLMSLLIFYGPWSVDMSRSEFLKRMELMCLTYLLSIPFINCVHAFMFGGGDSRLSRVTFWFYLVGILVALGGFLIARTMRAARARSSSPVVPPAESEP